MDRLELQSRVDALRWYHTIDLGQGVVTKGVDNSAERLSRLDFPKDLSGRSVLDIGAWDGFFSFEAERGTRRASSRPITTRGTASDGEPETGKLDSSWRATFWDRAFRTLMPTSWICLPRRSARSTSCLFLGVLYHVPNPLLALERVASVTGDLLVLETVVDMVGVRRPAAAFYPGRELNNDPTNWWGPNHAAVEGMLRSVGFDRVRSVAPIRSAGFRAARALYHAVRGQERSRLSVPTGPCGLSCVQTSPRPKYVACA